MTAKLWSAIRPSTEVSVFISTHRMAAAGGFYESALGLTAAMHLVATAKLRTLRREQPRGHLPVNWTQRGSLGPL
jgi:hypothetical protein